MPPVTAIIVGAGGRGSGYAGYVAAHPAEAKVVGVAEPRAFYRDRLAREHAIPPENVFTDWREAAARPRLADAVLICSHDDTHADAAVAFAAKGYHILLEKPMGTNEKDCRRIAKAALKAGVLFAVCHVMRYTRYTQVLKKMIESGLVGDVVNIQHLEPCGYWHQVHSFVRGSYGNEAKSSPMLLAKSCHDVDWIQYVMGARCVAVSSFGTLYHFRKEHQPAGAADRCLDCRVEAECPYSAKRIYMTRLERGETGWPLAMLTPDLTPDGVTEALRTGPYGRCVYACDNDVVDTQVLGMLFEGGRTATFTITAFSEVSDRKTRVFGTRGELRGDGVRIEHYDFLTEKTETVDTTQMVDDTAGYGHGGGDYGLMKAFWAALATNDPSKILTDARETLETHLAVFAAERARKEGRVVEVVV
ncbi:MAG TPA: Gfo/Idh/MocA family oxidoreductase [Phycisphaerae bacterium]|nr:Gfo/Idh/MocA family oxidoreductase [Phycisphaerae bacterium]